MNAVRQHISSILSFLSNLKSRYVCSSYRGTRQDTRADTAGCWCPKDPLLEHQCCQLSLHKLSERKICHMMIRLVFFLYDKILTHISLFFSLQTAVRSPRDRQSDTVSTRTWPKSVLIEPHRTGNRRVCNCSGIIYRYVCLNQHCWFIYILYY